MATIVFNVESYSVWLSPTIGYDARNVAGRALIICTGGSDRLKQYRCEFRFQDEDPLPASDYNQTARVAHIFVHARYYPWYVDLLRNERPVVCTIDRTTPRFSNLKTGSEAVGDGEQVVRA